MRDGVRYQLWIAAAASVIFFVNLGRPALFDMDEALYASTAREMLTRGDWIVPYFNGQMSAIKPPLSFWGMMAGFELFGPGHWEWGARFLSALFGVATALCAFHLGRILCNARVGFWTGLITASTIVFTISARAATVDSALTLLTTAAFLLFVLARKNGSGVGIQGSGEITSLNLPYAILMYASIGAAVLTKGPVGMVLPLGGMGLYLMVSDGWRNALRSVWRMRPVTAIVVMAAVVLPWHVAVWVRTDGAWVREFLLEANLHSFRQPCFSHGNTNSFGLDGLLAALVAASYYLYHIPAVLFGFFPWSVFLGPTLVDTVQRIRRRDQWRDPCLLAACWIGVWFVFWSLCKTKLPHYMLPAYPALALLTACYIDRWLTAQKSSGWLRSAWISVILTGIAIMIAIPIVSAVYMPGEAWLGSAGLILVLGGGWCWREAASGRHRQAASGFAVTSVVFLTAVFGFAVLRADRHQNARPMMAAIRADSPGASAAAIATYRFFRESTVFYAGYPVTRCDEGATGGSALSALREFLAQPSPAYVITTDAHEQEVLQAFPDKLRVIFRQPRFLARGEMVVLRGGMEE